MVKNAAPTPVTLHLNTSVAAITARYATVEMTDAGIFLDICSVATLAIAEMVFTIDGQILRTTSTAAVLYSALASLITQKRIPPVAKVATTVCKSNVRK